MSLPDKCPFCGAEVIERSPHGRWVNFKCYSWVLKDKDPRQSQSQWCEKAERTRLAARVAELEAENKQAREDEAWASDRTVLVEFQPVTSGWYASAPDGVVGISATASTIHGALRALREKVEGGAR